MSIFELVTWTLGTILAVCAVLGLGVKFILMPYLREHLVKPMRQVEKQVTENHHSNAEPTILDRLDDVAQQVRILSRMFEGHMDWSAEWVDRVETEIRKQAQRR